MTYRLKNKKALNDYIAKYAVRIEKALLFQLEYLVTELENHAKESAGYKDQTANLKGSIGGVLLKNGKPISYKGFDGAGKLGSRTGLEFINGLIEQNKKGYVIILVAGMEYATYVENYHNLNVLKKSELKMQNELIRIIETLKRKIV